MEIICNFIITEQNETNIKELTKEGNRLIHIDHTLILLTNI